MRKFIITISRQCGSGGHTIGEKLAERLKVPLYDKKILKIVAERSGLAEETIATIGEYANADYILRGCPDALHIFIHADSKDRCRRVVAEHGIDEKEAASHILERD